MKLDKYDVMVFVPLFVFVLVLTVVTNHYAGHG